jgi:cytochrome P450
MRAEAPVVWNPDAGYWVVSTHAEVVDVSRDPGRFSSAQGVLPLEIGVEYPAPPTMMHTDPPLHTQYRRLVQPGFAPSLLRALEPAVRRRAVQVLDALAGPGAAIDAVAAIAAPFPIMVIADLLGIPADDWERFLAWSDAAIPDVGDFTPEQRAEMLEAMQAYVLGLAEARRGGEGADLVTALASATVEGAALNEAELRMFFNQLLSAGNETTRNMIAGGLWALAEEPGEWDRLAADPTLIPAAVEEWLRRTTPVIAFMRTATADTELRGVTIRGGDPVLVVYASANRDEAAFGPSAHCFDVGRDPNPHVAFGFGAHFCIGAALARMEGRILLEELLARIARLEPAGDIERVPSSIIAGVKRAPLRFLPRRPPS